MGRLMEFFVSGSDVWCQTENGVERLDESNVELIDVMFDAICRLYPVAYESLKEWYARSERNISFFKFLCVQRFCKCNFGSLDLTEDDVTTNFKFHFERVQCPLRGECKYEGCVCMPPFNSVLSEAENRVMKLYYQGKSVNEISEELYLSPCTVRNHRASVYTKLGIHNKVEFIKYVNDNNLFK